MKSRFPVCLVAAFGALAAVLVGASSAAADDPEALFTEHFAQRWADRDADGLAELWTEDGSWMNLIGSRRIVRGREAIAGVWAVGLEGRDTPEALALDVRVDAVEVLAPELARVESLMVYGRGEAAIHEAMTAVVRRVEGRWRIVSAGVARLPQR